MFRKLALAASLVSSGFAVTANAADDFVFLAGATATDTAVRRVIVLEVCANTIERFNSPAGFTYRCIPKPAVGLPVGDRIIISKNTTVGSFTGIQNVRNSTIAPFIAKPFITATGSPTVVPATPPGTCVAGVNAAEFPGAPLTQLYTGCADTPGGNAFAPDGGLSDVEPKLFDTITPVVNNGLGNSWSNGLASVTAFAQAFALPVNEKTYRVLQADQKIGGCTTVPCVLGIDPGFTEANAPSLSAADVRGFFSGSATDWDAVSTAGSGSVAALAAANGLNTAVKVCRRNSSSGTQASFAAVLQGKPCLGASGLPFLTNAQDNCNAASGNNPNNDGGVGTGVGQDGMIGLPYPTVAVPFNPASTDGCFGSYTQVVNSGAGQVDVCLTNADNLGEMAIGILSTDRKPGDGVAPNGDDGDGVADKWRYVKFNGVFPSDNNVINCRYELVTESNFNRRAAGNGPAYSASVKAVLDFIQNATATPTNPLPGIYSLPSRGFTWDGTSQIIKCERGGNTCNPLSTTF